MRTWVGELVVSVDLHEDVGDSLAREEAVDAFTAP
jgi:hypothetical protein